MISVRNGGGRESKSYTRGFRVQRRHSPVSARVVCPEFPTGTVYENGRSPFSLCAEKKGHTKERPNTDEGAFPSCSNPDDASSSPSLSLPVSSLGLYEFLRLQTPEQEEDHFRHRCI